jgi:hypothetical protein
MTRRRQETQVFGLSVIKNHVHVRRLHGPLLGPHSIHRLGVYQTKSDHMLTQHQDSLDVFHVPTQPTSPMRDRSGRRGRCDRHTVTAVIAVTRRAMTAAASRPASPTQNVPSLTAPLPGGGAELGSSPGGSRAGEVGMNFACSLLPLLILSV